MRLLKRQKGLPFLLALGVLFVLSASFLAVQLWSDKKIMRGAVQALEAPVMPPAMPKVVAPPPVKKIARTQPAKSEVQPAEIKAEPEAAAVVEPVADINAAEVKIVTEAPADKAPEKKAAPAPVVEQAKPVVVPVVKTEKKPVTEKKAEKTVTIEKKDEKQSRPAKKAKKAKKTVEPVPTEIPAEWNWFAQPLKLSFNDGKAVIDKSEEDKAISLSSEEKVRTESATVDMAVSEEEKQPATAVAAIAEPSVEKPFVLALAKMARIRQMRSQNAAVSEEKTVETKTVAELSPSMKAMGSMLRELCEKLDKRAETASESLSAADKTETVEAVVEKQVEAADQSSLESASGAAETVAVSEEKTETSTDDLKLKPYYSGSGSSFSARIDSMLKQGLIKAE